MDIKVLANTFFRINTSQYAEGDIWFIHAYGESGLCYQSVFDSVLTVKYNVFIPDLPGFGVSPIQKNPLSIEGHVDHLISLIKNHSKTDKLYLVAHSVSGILGTQICEHFKDKIKLFVNIEGNLLTEDSYYSSLPIHHSKESFYKIYINSIYEKAKDRDDYLGYLASIRFANVEALYAWGQSSKGHILHNKPGEAFRKLECPKVYFWGDRDTPEATQKYIRTHKIPNIYFKNIGHWPMLEIDDQLYTLIFKLITNPDILAKYTNETNN